MACIDVNKALLELQKFSIDTSNQYGVGYSDCLTAVEDLLNDLQESSTSDVVEVVRCKDCKYFSEFQHCGVLGFCEPNEYCSRGERRKGDV